MNSSTRIESLDSLRGVAAIIVVIFHCLISFTLFYEANYNGVYTNAFMEWFNLSPLRTIWAGNEAVLLFFVLSGFVLAIPFLNNKASGYNVYFIKRVCRIYIPYIVIMAISVLMVTLFASYNNIESLSPTFSNRWDHAVSLQAIAAYVLMLNYDTANVNGVVWSLFHEMRISIIFPLIMFIIIKFEWKRALSISLSILFVVWGGFYSASSVFSGSMLAGIFKSFADTAYYCALFVFGALLSKHRVFLVNKAASFSGLVKGSLLLTALLLINPKWIFEALNFSGGMLTDFIPAIGILILFIVVLSSVRLDKLLTSKPLLWLGKVSYSLYLTHILVIMMAGIFLSKIMPMEMAFVLVPFLALPVAYLSYRYVEMPSIQIGKSLSSKISQPYLIPFLKKFAGKEEVSKAASKS